jgi:hypothetical protein
VAITKGYVQAKEDDMLRTPKPSNESERIQKLHEYHILNTPPEQAFDDIVSLAALICGVPMAHHSGRQKTGMV